MGSDIYASSPVSLAGRSVRLARRFGRFLVFCAVGFAVMIIATALLFVFVDVLNLPLALGYALQVVVAVNLG